MRLKPFLDYLGSGLGVGGNRGGFSFEIETICASCKRRGYGARGNRGGFSFEIETSSAPASCQAQARWQPGRLLV